MKTICCASCGCSISSPNGYAIVTATNEKICYICSANLTKQDMIVEGRVILYLIKNEVGWEIMDWPGKLRFPTLRVKRNKHNWRHVQRIDAWFVGPEGAIWHALNIGDNQIVRCKRTKHKRYGGYGNATL